MPYGNSIRVRLPADLAAWVRQRAREEGRTTSEVVREAVDAYLQQSNGAGEGKKDEEEEQDEDSLHVRLPVGLRAADAERLIRHALRAYRAGAPRLRPAPSTAVGGPADNIIVRLEHAPRARLETIARRHGVGIAAVVRHALATARQTTR